MRLSAAFDNATEQCVATLAGCDGIEDCVRFDSAESFRSWLQDLQARLEREHSAAVADPVLLPTGWPNRRLG